MTSDERENIVFDILQAYLGEENTYEYHYSCLAEKIVKALMEGWIPVSERLPKSHDVYNVTRLIDGAYISDSCFYDGRGTWYDDTRINHDRKYLDDVIAWMPLPEPYKEEGEEE